MNKVFTLIAALLCAFAASAASFTVKVGDNVVKNGDNIVSTSYTIEEWVPGELYGLTIDPHLTVTPSKAGLLTVTMNSLDGSDDVKFCWPGLCKMVTASGATDSKNVAAGSVENLLLDFELDFEAECPVVSRKVKVKIDLDGEKFEFTLTLTNESGSVSTVDVAAPVTIAAGVMNYNLPSASTINVYSIVGSLVKSQSVSGSGSIDLSTLPKGIYIYNVAGKKKSSGKFQIR